MRLLLLLLILACSLGNVFGQAADTATCRLTAAQFPSKDSSSRHPISTF